MHAELSNNMTEQALMGITIPPCPASLSSIMREAQRPSTGFTSLAHLISRDAGIVHMAECIADEHLFVRDKEWHQFGSGVLKYFDISEQEFSELKGDVLAYLDGE